MKEADRRKMGERIAELRASSPHRQRDMARRLKISPRMYQKNEERGTTKWDRVQKIARIHKADPYWIWTGEKQKPKADPAALKRLEITIAELRVDVAELGVDLARGRAQQQKWNKRARELRNSEDPA